MGATVAPQLLNHTDYKQSWIVSLWPHSACHCARSKNISLVVLKESSYILCSPRESVRRDLGKTSWENEFSALQHRSKPTGVASRSGEISLETPSHWNLTLHQQVSERWGPPRAPGAGPIGLSSPAFKCSAIFNKTLFKTPSRSSSDKSVACMRVWPRRCRCINH